MYDYKDAYIKKRLYQIIKPFFKHISSLAWHHFLGAMVIKTVTHHILDALTSSRHRYVIRADIMLYYAYQS